MLFVALVGCGGSFAPVADGSAPDVVAEASEPMDAVTTTDAGTDASCWYAGGCCAALGDVQCINGSMFDCQGVDDAGTRGWVAMPDAGDCE